MHWKWRSKYGESMLGVCWAAGSITSAAHTRRSQGNLISCPSRRCGVQCVPSPWTHGPESLMSSSVCRHAHKVHAHTWCGHSPPVQCDEMGVLGCSSTQARLNLQGVLLQSWRGCLLLVSLPLRLQCSACTDVARCLTQGAVAGACACDSATRQAGDRCRHAGTSPWMY